MSDRLHRLQMVCREKKVKRSERKIANVPEWECTYILKYKWSISVRENEKIAVRRKTFWNKNVFFWSASDRGNNGLNFIHCNANFVLLAFPRVCSTSALYSLFPSPFLHSHSGQRGCRSQRIFQFTLAMIRPLLVKRVKKQNAKKDATMKMRRWKWQRVLGNCDPIANNERSREITAVTSGAFFPEEKLDARV